MTVINRYFTLFSIFSLCLNVSSSYPRAKRATRATDPSLGLRPNNLHKNGIAIGFLPAFGEPIAPNEPTQINAKLPAPMAIMGDYINLEQTGPNANAVKAHLGYIKGLKGNPVWQIALMPYQGLDMVTPEVANSIAETMLQINNQGITVWLRFAHEMNGDWYKWGMQPQLFLEKWKMVYKAIKSKTTGTYMLWAPNSLFGGVNDVRGGYTPYWPGAQYVDMLGLSFYHYGGFERNNVLPGPTMALDMIKQFSDLYSTPNNLPIVLSETGASYTVSLETGQPAPGGASEHDMKFGWLKQLLANNLRSAVPNFKAFSWFEIKKNENASGGSAVKSEDFRLLMGNQDLSKAAVAYLSS